MGLKKRWGYKKEKLKGVGGRDANDVIYSGLNLSKSVKILIFLNERKKIRLDLVCEHLVCQLLIDWLIIFNCFSLKQNLILQSNLSSNTTIVPLSSAGIIHIWHIVLVIQLQCVFFSFDRLMIIITNTICGFDFAYCYSVCVVVCVQGCACHDTHVEIRGQCCELSSLLSSLCVCMCVEARVHWAKHV